MMPEFTVGVLDMGSNSVKINITGFDGEGKKLFAKTHRKVIRLIEDMKNNKLSRHAAERTISALNELKGYAEECSNLFAVSTEAVRKAENGSSFLEEVRNKTGFEFVTLSTYKEAYYGYLAVLEETGLKNCVIIDVGGGSSEITLVINSGIYSTVSLPIGAVNLTGRFKSMPHEDMVSFVREGLGAIEFLPKIKGMRLAAVGGTADAVAGAIGCASFSKDKLFEFYENVRNAPLDKRGEIQGVPKDRGDIILAGVTVINELASVASPPEIVVCDGGLREGITLYVKDKILKGLTRIEL